MKRAKNNNVVDLTGWRRNESVKVLEQLFSEHGDALHSFVGPNYGGER